MAGLISEEELRADLLGKIEAPVTGLDKTGTIGAATTEISFSDLAYDSTKDYVMFFIGGIMQPLGTTYTLDKVNKKLVEVNGEWPANTFYHIIIIKR